MTILKTAARETMLCLITYVRGLSHALLVINVGRFI